MKVIIKKGIVHDNSNIDNSHIGEYTEIGSFNIFENVNLGDFSYTGNNCILQNTEVGKFSNIASMVRIGPTDHPMERASLHHFTYRRVMYEFDIKDDEEFFIKRKGRVTIIGHDSWIGHGVIIMSGVNIGIGAVVGSGAVVTKDIPDYCIAVGNPAKVIKYRFTKIQQDELKKISWWDWPHNVLKERIDDFAGPIDDFINNYRRD